MAEKKFAPKKGQVDYTNIRYCPVINCVVKHRGRILLVKRSKDLRFYPGYWNGVSGFLDDQQGIDDKVYEELEEELGISRDNVSAIKRGNVLVQESANYKKTWIVFPILVTVKTTKHTLDWEAMHAEWVFPHEIKGRKLLPGFDEVLAQFL